MFKKGKALFKPSLLYSSSLTGSHHSLRHTAAATAAARRVVDVPAADHGHALDAEGRSEDFTRAGEVDALLAAGDPRAVTICQIT